MRHAIWLALACYSPPATLAQSPTAFQQEVIFSADSAELCDDFAKRVRADVSSDNSDAKDWVDPFTPAARYADLIGTDLVRTPYYVTINITLFSGDVDGDGTRETLLTTMRGGGRADGYQDFVVFTRLSEDDHQAALNHAQKETGRRRLWKEGTFILKARELGLTTGGDPRRSNTVTEPQDAFYPEDIQLIVKRALSYPEPLQIVEYNRRLFVDQPVISPRHALASSVRTLISFDQEMRAKVECVVSETPGATPLED